MERWYTRQQLYDLVWEKPMSKLAKELSISDVGLSKACRRADIPVPDRGYWAKIQSGKPVVKPSLPPRGFGCSDELGIGTSYYAHRPQSEKELLESPLPPAPSFDEPLQDVMQRAEKAIGKVVIPRDFSRMHASIRKLFEADDRRREKGAKSGYSWYNPLFESPYERRRLAILNALALAIAPAGGNFSTRGAAARELYFRVGDTGLSATLDAKNAVMPSEYSKSQVTPANAVLEFCIEFHGEVPERSRSEWRDQPGRSIEKQLSEIATAIIVLGEYRYRENTISHYSYLVERREELVKEARKRAAEAARKEDERLAKLAEARRQELWREAEDWKRAEQLRNYVSAVAGDPRLKDHPRIQAWSDWALSEADRIDPLRQPHTTYTGGGPTTPPRSD